MKRLGLGLLLCVLATALAAGPSRAATGVIVSAAPPAPVIEAVPRPPAVGYIWRPGHWQWTGAAYVWIPGVYVPAPHPAAVWVPGHWLAQGGGWVWVGGYWRS